MNEGKIKQEAADRKISLLFIKCAGSLVSVLDCQLLTNFR